MSDDGRPPWQPPADPHGLDLADHAAIAAELAEGVRPSADVLADHGLDESRWAAATRYWMGRLADDARRLGADCRLAIDYSQAFAAAQDRLKTVVELTPEQFAELVVAIQRRGSPKHPLGERGLSLADYTRLSRHFAALFTSDARAQQRFFDTFVRLQPKPKA